MASKMAYTAVLLLAMLVVSARVHASLTCGEITKLLTPCISYAMVGGAVPPDCCKGIYALNAASNTTEDHRAACSCIKDGLSKIPGINYHLVATLPQACNTTCSYTITPTVDCSKVN
ncbi:Non-specific lipid-transfer protein [Morella rubra]|uniref:Non-specific lipid-transfer protein n=1 Tax=Morella rubra TaxID=262757 RepID=A0A6A1WKJ6_9ROSI|nr:Non-specific lipid-transfer protein [Morella rubra]KAB1225674.1 Non-specific lipid-transfer protein [Morella rubra]KAB1225678.1 Non-specific lipid-transfer protein [Morella rubra]